MAETTLSRPTIRDWKATRSGATITVAGRDAAGEPWRVTEIVSVTVRDGRVVALDRGNNEYLLAV